MRGCVTDRDRVRVDGLGPCAGPGGVDWRPAAALRGRRGLDWTSARLIAKGINIPGHKAARTSDGQCTPSTSRDDPTRLPHSSASRPSTGQTCGAAKRVPVEPRPATMGVRAMCATMLMCPFAVCCLAYRRGRTLRAPSILLMERR